MTKAKFIMAEKIYSSLSVDGIEEELGVGQARFYEAFKAYTGTYPLSVFYTA
ncbi:hypothetical protein MASR2M78_04140 [Treponema sp.]